MLGIGAELTEMHRQVRELGVESFFGFSENKKVGIEVMVQ